MVVQAGKGPVVVETSQLRTSTVPDTGTRE